MLVAVVVLAGCDAAFSLSRPPIDAPPPDAPDSDDDGFADDLDNCPAIRNPDQSDRDVDLRGDVCDLCPLIADEPPHDEDGDLVADVCDNCPHVVNANQLNADGDGIGDACDLATTIECIQLFDPFTTMPAVAANENVGTWIIENDMLVQTMPLLEDGYFVFAPTFTAPRLETRAQVREVPDTGSGGTHNVGGWVSIGSGTFQDGIPIGLLGVAFYVPSNGETNLRVTTVTSSGPMHPQTLPLSPSVPIVAGSIIALRVHLQTPNELSLRADIGQSVAGIVEPLNGRPPGRVGLRTYDVSVGFEFVIVIETQPTGPCP